MRKGRVVSGHRHEGSLLDSRDGLSTFAHDVLHHLQLTPRQLPSRYLYDALGSALFDAICELPWYAITRAESRLLSRHRDELFARLPGLSTFIELGPGTGRKLHALLGGSAPRSLRTAHLIDLSATALATAARTLADIPGLSVVTHEASFEAGLDAVGRLPRTGRRVVLFLGSNIGNFDTAASALFLNRIRASIGSGDALLLGADLVKPERDLLLAYDDPLGVSAAFNRNVLVRLNRELGANFDVAAFGHRAVWNAPLSRMEMYLVALAAQRVRIDAADLELDLVAGESIWTESSYKYQPDGIVSLVESAGFCATARFVDERDRFALILFEAVSPDRRTT